MRILLAHNFYREPGGEDEVFEQEAAMLGKAGHEVYRFTLDNRTINEMSRLATVRTTLWNAESSRKLRDVLVRNRPDVVHFHNTFPVMSPSAHRTAKAAGKPVIQTLHNYRFVCANGLLFRDGVPCEDCLGKKFRWPGVVHGCYRESRAASAVATGWQIVQQWKKDGCGSIDRYVALSHFARTRLIAGGVPEAKIDIKPNFLNTDPGVGDGSGGYALFVGRLTRGKGVETLIRAWTKHRLPVPLKIAGDGPLSREVRVLVAEIPHVELLGWQPKAEVLNLMKAARFLVFPSQFYENLPMTLVEAYATGLPVIASGHGSMIELVEPEETGVFFEPGNCDDLAAQVERLARDSDQHAQMRRHARSAFEDKYSTEANYPKLMEIYARAAGVGTVIGRECLRHAQAGPKKQHFEI